MPSQKAGARLRAEIVDIVVIATGRVVTADMLRESGGDLQAAGVNSIGLINILEALERRFGLAVGAGQELGFLETVDAILARVQADGGPTAEVA